MENNKLIEIPPSFHLLPWPTGKINITRNPLQQTFLNEISSGPRTIQLYLLAREKQLQAEEVEAQREREENEDASSNAEEKESAMKKEDKKMKKLAFRLADKEQKRAIKNSRDMKREDLNK